MYKQIPTHEAGIRRQTVIDRLSGKMSKGDVNYRQVDPTETKEMCGECDYYESPGNPTAGCMRVAGVVESEGVCDLFYARPTEGVPGPMGSQPSVQHTVNIHIGRAK